MFLVIYSRLLGCSTARGSGSGLSLGGPTKVNARKSFLFTGGSLKVEIKNTCLILLSHFILSCFAKMLYAVAKCSQICRL